MVSFLFRSEATQSRANRLSGDILLAIPLPWQTIGYLLFGGIAVALVFLSFASYSRIETVTGSVVPDTGVSSIIPTRSGIIVELAVKDGQQVAKGDILAAIRVEEDSSTGLPVAARIEEAAGLQDASLAAQMAASASAAQAQIRQLAAQRTGLAAEISQIRSQIDLQQGLIDSAGKDLDRARQVAARGFVSKRDLQVREETLIARQQGLAQLHQTLSAKRAALTEAERASAQAAAQARAQNASLAASRAQVAQQVASAAGARSYVLRAPVAGQVTALTARVGQPSTPDVPLMTIVPAGSTLRAELAVPSAAIGFIEPGQPVRLAIDAFPYQRFGTVEGKVLSVASSALTRRDPNGATSPVYPVAVELDHAEVTAFGRTEPLIAGMTLTARIVTDKQTLLEWLFEPLFAVRRR